MISPSRFSKTAHCGSLVGPRRQKWRQRVELLEVVHLVRTFGCLSTDPFGYQRMLTSAQNSVRPSMRVAHSQSSCLGVLRRLVHDSCSSDAMGVPWMLGTVTRDRCRQDDHRLGGSPARSDTPGSRMRVSQTCDLQSIMIDSRKSQFRIGEYELEVQ